MDLDFLNWNSRDFGTDEAAEVEMTHETIVFLMMLVRQFVLRIGFAVMAFRRLEFLDNVLDRVHRLEYDRKKYGHGGNEVEYGESRFHGGKFSHEWHE